MTSNDGATNRMRPGRQKGFPYTFVLRRLRWTGKESTVQGHTAKKQPDWELREISLIKEVGP